MDDLYTQAIYNLTMKWIGVPGESGVCVTSLSSVIHRKGVGESLAVRMSNERSSMEHTSGSSVLHTSKLSKLKGGQSNMLERHH